MLTAVEYVENRGVRSQSTLQHGETEQHTESRTVWSAMRANTVYTTWYTIIFELYRFVARSLARSHARTFAHFLSSLTFFTMLVRVHFDSSRLVLPRLASSVDSHPSLLSLGWLVEWLCHVSVLVSSRFRFLSFLYFPQRDTRTADQFVTRKKFIFSADIRSADIPSNNAAFAYILYFIV